MRVKPVLSTVVCVAERSMAEESNEILLKILLIVWRLYAVLLLVAEEMNSLRSGRQWRRKVFYSFEIYGR